MKSLQLLIYSIVLALSPVAFAADDPAVQEYLREGQAAFVRGDYAAAKSAFQMVYSIDPRNITAINFLRRIKVAEESRPKYTDQQQQLAGIVIPQIQFREATLGSALDFLKKAVEKQTGGKQAANFVVQLPAEQVNTQTVTLNLTNVPFTEAVRYLAELANATVSYDRYAIMIKPKAAVAPAPTTAPQ